MKFGTVTYIGPYRGSFVKLRFFWKSNMAAAPCWKSQKIAISPQRFDQSLRNLVRWCKMGLLTYHTHTFNGPLSGTTRVRRYQKGKTNLDFTGAGDSEWQWHQLGMCKSAPRSRQITTPAPHHSVFYRPDALPAAQPTASKHWRHETYQTLQNWISKIQDGGQLPFWKPRGNWQDFNWHNASCGPSAIAELLVSINFSMHSVWGMVRA